MKSLVALACLLVSISASVAAAAEFTGEEKRAILSHGPWPPKLERDPSNRVSGKPQAAALGERLFFEPRLSGTGSVLCATCHAPFRRFQDGRPRGFGLEEAARNTPTLLDVRFNRRFGWDGGHDTLWSQSLRPLLDPREMRSSAAHVASFIRSNASFSAGYQRVFGRPIPEDDEAVLVDVGKALAAYQETLVSGRAPFDEFRDALERDDAAGMAAYPAAARRGLKLFVGKGRCSACHAGPRFTNGGFADSGVSFLPRDGVVDAGRHGEFRIPSLRAVAETAPYMHDGSIATLADVLKLHSKSNRLTPAERADLVAFLETLSIR